MIASLSDGDASSSTASTSASPDKVSITSKCLACAPVTALQILSPPHSNLLLAAQGPSLKLYDVHHPKKTISELKLWSFQRIHGIVPSDTVDDGNETEERLIVFGGKHVAIILHDREK